MSLTDLERDWSTVLCAHWCLEGVIKEKRLLFIVRANVFEENEDVG